MTFATSSLVGRTLFPVQHHHIDSARPRRPGWPMPPKHASKRASAGTPPGGGSCEPAEAAKKRRAVVSMACERCRSRKSKCDGERPVCSPCANQSQECRYATEVSVPARRQQTQALREEVVRLRALLERAAAGSGMTLDAASASTPSSLQQTLLPGSLSPIASPSDHDAVRATIPYTQSPLEFELMCKHPNACHVLEPHGPSGAIANALLTFEESPFLPGSTDNPRRSPALPRAALAGHGKRLQEQQQQQQQRESEEAMEVDTEDMYSGIQMNLDVAASKERSGTVEDLAKRLETTVLAERDGEEGEEGGGEEEDDEDAVFEEWINFGADS
ncbi:hypothetical protein BST61_g10285 [Cercospora zeina]